MPNIRLNIIDYKQSINQKLNVRFTKNDILFSQKEIQLLPYNRKILKKFSKELSENEDQHYVGNVFGWKISLIGLIIILFFVLFAWYRKTYHYNPDFKQVTPIEIEAKPNE